MEDIRSMLIQELTLCLSNNVCMVDRLLHICNSYYEKPAHNLQDMKSRNTKIKGDIFECFTQLYLKDIYGLKEVWLLNEIPEDIRIKLNLRRKDYGIDLVGIDINGKLYAIQSKFRKRSVNRKVCISWKELSTFYALCERTGPYDKYIVFTTADYVNRIGKKTQKDITIGFNQLLKLSHFDWIKICGSLKTNQNIITQQQSFSLEELRQKRLKFLESQ